MTIEQTINNGFCSACGACYAVCPQRAINMVEIDSGFVRPDLNKDKCVDCELCYKVCPGNSKKKNNCSSTNIIKGNIIKCYIGYATDSELRKNGQSGGVISALIMYLLDSGKIKTAIGAGFDSRDNRPHPVHIKSKEDIINNSGSMYTQVAVLSSVKEIKAPYAVTTLGCQSDALKGMSKYNTNKPEYTLGLFCEGQYSGRLIDYLADVKKGEHLNSFRFKDKRCGTWPGDVVYTKEKTSFVKDKEIRNAVKKVFECHRCVFCHDLLNKNADISIGDPWGIPKELCEGKDEGFSVLISRTDTGQNLIDDAIRNNYIVCQEISPEYTINNQVGDLYKAKLLYSKQWGEEKLKYPYDDSVKREIDVTCHNTYSKHLKKDVYARLDYSFNLWSENGCEIDKALKKHIKKEKWKYNISKYGKTCKAVIRHIKKICKLKGV